MKFTILMTVTKMKMHFIATCFTSFIWQITASENSTETQISFYSKVTKETHL